MATPTQGRFDILGKTEKGREEIATRKHNLSGTLRRFLVLIDGKHSKTDLLDQFSSLGLNENTLMELIEQDFVTTLGRAPGEPDEPNEVTPLKPAQRPVVGAATEGPSKIRSEPEAAEALPVTQNASATAEQFHELYNFFTQTVKSTMGLRGLAFQLKVEKASCIDDFRALRTPYVEAVQKSKGIEMARSLGLRLDELLSKT